MIIRRLSRMTFPLLAFASLATLVLGFAGCDEEFARPDVRRGTGDQIRVVSGNEQRGFVGQALRQPLRVQVRDVRGNPVRNQRVEFRILRGDGSFSSLSGVTDFAGFTQVSFTPLEEGDLVVEAQTAGAGSGAVFAFTAIDLSRIEDPAIFEKISGDNQTGPVGTVLPLPLTVRVANEFGTPLDNFPVLFTANTDGTLLLTANDGDFTQPDTTDPDPSPSDSIGRQIVSFSDDNGIAAVLVRLDTRPGNNQVTASTTFTAGANNALVFNLTGTAGGSSSADSLAKIAGDEQDVTIDTTGIGFTPSITLNPMVVQVTDRFGNPVPGITVFFRISNGFGTLSASSDVTDESGIAETTFTSSEGSQGGIAVTAFVPGIGTTTFTGSITPVGGTPDDPIGDTLGILLDVGGGDGGRGGG
ncbi:MAG: Ig-like domain-containing protein [Gemmatimonadetes bacterium]|nr:Ig-like domain-containing protein [Gemmatimonadota bacterium]